MALYDELPPLAYVCNLAVPELRCLTVQDSTCKLGLRVVVCVQLTVKWGRVIFLTVVRRLLFKNNELTNFTERVGSENYKLETIV